MKKILGVDPSINTCGWGVVEQRDDKTYQCRKHGIIKGNPTSDDWTARADHVAACIVKLARFYRCRRVAVEIPATYLGYGDRRAPGHLFKLFFVIGCIVTDCRRAGLRVTAVPVSRWKGNLPKEVCYDRTKKYTGFTDIPKTAKGFNVSDAIGIALYAFRGK